MEDEAGWFAAPANGAVAECNGIGHVNLVGFYLIRGGYLVLGPFHGRPI